VLAALMRASRMDSSSTAIASFAEGDMAPSLAPCTVRLVALCSRLLTLPKVESMVVSHSLPSWMLRAYWALAAWAARVRSAAAVAEGSSEGTPMAFWLEAWFCSLSSSEEAACRFSEAARIMVTVVTRVIISDPPIRCR
jgi:hypothetical protein